MSDGRNASLSRLSPIAPSPTAFGVLMLVVLGLSTLAAPTLAQHFSNEKDIVDLRLGQRVKVDDGTCPAGQVKEISGTKMTNDGVVRTRKCIPRAGTKHK